MYLMMSEDTIKENWEDIKLDEFFPYPDMEKPEEFIALAKSRRVYIGGALVCISGPMKIGGSYDDRR